MASSYRITDETTHSKIEQYDGVSSDPVSIWRVSKRISIKIQNDLLVIGIPLQPLTIPRILIALPASATDLDLAANLAFMVNDSGNGGGGSFTLSNGNGTTANGTSVDLQGQLTRMLTEIYDSNNDKFLVIGDKVDFDGVNAVAALGLVGIAIAMLAIDNMDISSQGDLDLQGQTINIFGANSIDVETGSSGLRLRIPDWTTNPPGTPLVLQDTMTAEAKYSQSPRVAYIYFGEASTDGTLRVSDGGGYPLFEVRTAGTYVPIGSLITTNGNGTTLNGNALDWTGELTLVATAISDITGTRKIIIGDVTADDGTGQPAETVLKGFLLRIESIGVGADINIFAENVARIGGGAGTVIGASAQRTDLYGENYFEQDAILGSGGALYWSGDPLAPAVGMWISFKDGVADTLRTVRWDGAIQRSVAVTPYDQRADIQYITSPDTAAVTDLTPIEVAQGAFEIELEFVGTDGTGAKYYTETQTLSGCYDGATLVVDSIYTIKPPKTNYSPAPTLSFTTATNTLIFQLASPVGENISWAFQYRMKQIFV
jgi:hypothetical protein